MTSTGQFYNLDFCEKPLQLGMIEYGTIQESPQCKNALNTTLTLEAFNKRCPRFSDFISSMKLIESQCPSVFQTILVSLVSLTFQDMNSTEWTKKADFIPELLAFSDPASGDFYEPNVIFSLPFSYTKDVLIASSKSTFCPKEAMTLLLSPLDWSVWFCCVVVLIAALLVDVLCMKSHYSKRLLHFRQVTALLYVMYCSNLKAVISQSKCHPPFKDFTELGENLNSGKQQILMMKSDPDWLPVLRSAIPGTNQYQPQWSNENGWGKILKTVENSSSTFYITSYDTALDYFDAYKLERSANFEVFPLDSGLQMWGFLLSKRQKHLAEYLSRAATILSSIDTQSLTRRSNRREKVKYAKTVITIYIGIKHLKLAFLAAVLGYVASFVAIITELITTKRKKSWTIPTFESDSMEIWPMGSYKEVPV